jgi:tetratricopeptide (TPR) repeat protein
MIKIYVSAENLESVIKLIDQEDRLNELVSITSSISDNVAIKVDDNIEVLPDWENLQPPVLFPVSLFRSEILLGIVYAKLNNFEKSYELLERYPNMLKIVDVVNRLQNGIPLEGFEIQPQSYEDLHNKAIGLHYNEQNGSGLDLSIIETYQKAIGFCNEKSRRQFTTYHLIQFFIDQYDEESALKLIEISLQDCDSPAISVAFKDLLCKIWQKKLVVPYDEKLLTELKSTLWECLQYYELNGRNTEAAMILLDATYIATISESFSEALGYINRAIAIFEKEQQLELIAHAELTKGNLLQTWAQNGSPQFYRNAVQAYQTALKTFTKEQYPELFAEIQHQLGKVYAEIPDEVKKKGVWAAVSVSSFNEALNYFNKVDFPYQFAMICNSMGNAYTKYPASLHSDNFEKALAWYREALDIRTATSYPLERVLTLCNYLEASWFVGNKEAFDLDRFNEMMNIANEIILLSDDEKIIQSAQSDIQRLNKLRAEAIN